MIALNNPNTPRRLSDQVYENLDEILFALEIGLLVEEFAEAAGVRPSALSLAIRRAMQHRHGCDSSGRPRQGIMGSPMDARARLFFAGHIRRRQVKDSFNLGRASKTRRLTFSASMPYSITQENYLNL